MGMGQRVWPKFCAWLADLQCLGLSQFCCVLEFMNTCFESAVGDHSLAAAFGAMTSVPKMLDKGLQLPRAVPR
jgi:hypothetical protein